VGGGLSWRSISCCLQWRSNWSSRWLAPQSSTIWSVATRRGWTSLRVVVTAFDFSFGLGGVGGDAQGEAIGLGSGGQLGEGVGWVSKMER
jgi:hypothetical protein